ncbi:MAG: penicillin acylase family protein [Pyrinomonadaceae bacterium]
MQPFKRLLRAHWALISLPALSLCLLVLYGIWLVGNLVAVRLNPTTQLWVAVGLGIFVLILAALAFKLRLLLFFLVSLPIKLRASMPRLEQRATLADLDETVTVTFDRFGIPTINALSRLDAMRALGYVSARDRLFQMDMLKRAAAGRMSEVVGRALLEKDTRQRIIGFNRVAQEIVSRLPEDQREILQAYSEGVNAYISQMKSRPFEFLLLNYRPEIWTSKDSVLVLLQMFQGLCGEQEGKSRMLAVMEQTLPEEVVAFLTPDTDPYMTMLGWGHESHNPIRPLPRVEMASLLREREQQDAPALEKKIVQTEWVTAGSNCWAVDKRKTAAGRAILSNDMHTELAVPNLWYRARLCYDSVDLNGVIIAGIPLILAGSNTHVAWGLTNMMGACLDLVTLEVDPERPDHYLTPEGWRPFELLNEPVRLKRGDIINVEVKKTIWGPVLEKTLMGKQVALRWTALDPDSVDFGLMHMEKASTVEEAVRAINRFAGPPLNVIVADREGRIAYTLCGKLPARKRSDSAAVKSWDNGSAGWTDYIRPDELPKISESSAAFLVSANNISIGSDYPFILGHGYVHSYRAYRIAERLREMSRVSETDMFELQFDTACHVYEFYRQLALEVLTDEVVATAPELMIVRRAVLAWDGKASLDSYGLIFLIHFKESLAQSVFTPLLRDCVEADDEFIYSWPNLDTPLRIILTEKPPELLIEPERHANWDSFILENLKSSIGRVKEMCKVKSLENLNWGKLNKAEIFHPFAQKDRSPLGGVLNMPEDSLAGCNFSVCASEPGFGASVRMVVSPGQEGEGVLHIACGQSGHPLSDSYDDQHKYWVEQEPLPFLPGPAVHTLNLTPQTTS